MRFESAGAARLVAEEASAGPGMGVIVVGDVPHVIVQPELPEPGRRDLGEARAHVGEVLLGRSDAVEAPDHHGCVADVALGNPADVVLVVPRRDAGGAAEVAVGLAREGLVGGIRSLPHGRSV